MSYRRRQAIKEQKNKSTLQLLFIGGMPVFLFAAVYQYLPVMSASGTRTGVVEGEAATVVGGLLFIASLLWYATTVHLDYLGRKSKIQRVFTVIAAIFLLVAIVCICIRQGFFGVYASAIFAMIYLAQATEFKEP